jgi:ParB family transcriptional regulator, chromosome partitioning protein
MPDIHHIPLAEIDAAALDRDRSHLDAAALTELRLSIATSGLRMPIEVYPFATPDPTSPHRYGLISGFRRLAAVRALAETAADPARYATIPAFLRTPRDAADAYRQMVEENAIRAELSPWEQAMVAVKSARAEAHPGIDAAIEDLYANLSRQKRTRLRTIAHLADDLDGYLTAPTTLSERQLLRLAPLIPRGYADVLRATLAETAATDPEAEWRALLPILLEAERPEPANPAPARPGRPRRVLELRPRGLTIRRELTRQGWALHFTGRNATSDMLDCVFDEIERLFSPPEPREPSKHLPPARFR